VIPQKNFYKPSLGIGKRSKKDSNISDNSLFVDTNHYNGVTTPKGLGSNYGAMQGISSPLIVDSLSSPMTKTPNSKMKRLSDNHFAIASKPIKEFSKPFDLRSTSEKR